MAQVIAESGVSAGSVYRYFPSKADLILAAGDWVLGRVLDAADEAVAIRDEASPVAVMRVVFERIHENLHPDGEDRSVVALSVWQEATRDARVAAMLQHNYGELRARVRVLVVRWRDAGHLPVSTDADGLATALFALIPGLIVQHHALGAEIDSGAAFGAIEALFAGAEAAAHAARDQAQDV